MTAAGTIASKAQNRRFVRIMKFASSVGTAASSRPRGGAQALWRSVRLLSLLRDIKVASASQLPDNRSMRIVGGH
jgi:hypothetical protein